jgi:hypothetical protein
MATTEDVDGKLAGGNYEVLRQRLRTVGQELALRAEALNQKRKKIFGTTEPQLVATERLRTEHNCNPVDIVSVGEHLMVGFHVFLGLKAETVISDVLALHRFEPSGSDGGFDCSPLPLDSDGGFLAGEVFKRDFATLFRYYRGAKLLQLIKRETLMLAVFQAGATCKDLKVFRWRIDAGGAIAYVDDRGDRDYATLFPEPYDFEWVEVTRENQVTGRHPHYDILNTLFVETIGGTLTIKVENNTETGRGILDEPVEDANQTLDDGRFYYAPIGTGTSGPGLILLKILPFREERWRYFVYDTRARRVLRADGIAQGCRGLPEDHGIVFPGGYVLVGGDAKLFDGDFTDFMLEREIRSPNGEDILYVYSRLADGAYVLCPYNLISKEIAAPIHCSGYSLFADGRMVVFRSQGSEPSRVHPMQVWRTPFTSADFAASKPSDGSYLAKVGNADLVRGLSDILSICRLTGNEQPRRRTFEDILTFCNRAPDAYYWLGHADAGDLKTAVADVKTVAKQILDEYEKVVALEAEARKILANAEEQVAERLRSLQSESWDKVAPFLDALTSLRGLRGTLISLKETRFIDVRRLDELEAQVVASFERVTTDCVALLARGQAFGELVERARSIAVEVAKLDTAVAVKPQRESIEQVAGGLALLGEVIGSLKIDDTTKRTAILENITEAFGQVNQARATVEQRQRELAAKEGKAAFGAQIKLLTQSVTSALAQCDSPERCDQELTKLLVQLEELESRFSDVEDLTCELAVKREEIVDAVGTKKQQLQGERQRRVANLQKAAQRILEGVVRRAAILKAADEVNAYFASDAMVAKLRDLADELTALGDAVKGDELIARLTAARQDALRGQRDRADLFEGEGDLIRLGSHRFAVNKQTLELMLVPHENGLAVHLTGTDFFEKLDDPSLEKTRALWGQDLPSESEQVYRGEYLAASILFDAEAKGEPALQELREAVRAGELAALVGRIAQERYDEGYTRGVHDHDAAKIFERLLGMRDGAGRLSIPAATRGLAMLFWGGDSSSAEETAIRIRWHRHAQSLARLADVLGNCGSEQDLSQEIASALSNFLTRHPSLPGLGLAASLVSASAQYLVRELAVAKPRFVVSGEALAIRDALFAELQARGARTGFDEDLAALAGAPASALALALAWVRAVVARHPNLAPAAIEAAVLLCTPRLDRNPSNALIEARLEGLLGRHGRILDGTMTLRLDEVMSRLETFQRERVPAFRAYRTLRGEIADRERDRLRLAELRPRVMSAFVRNRLIDEVYLPLVGANLAKQLGAVGAGKRTDQMGMLLLISPPGYGKTTLMEYVATRLGLVFVKVNGPALGHTVTSIDPSEAPNATARQEVERINIALEMGSNVMLYLDDIQHTSPELLQKFISLCDAQRKIEGVWRGRTRTYDLRGKKFCVVMAGNPYTESGSQFQIPDMLANRADVYNLGEVLSGRDDAFSLSYLENALTSNPTLAPLATRELGDVYKLVRMAQGEPIPTSELSHGYSATELEEILTVIRHLFRVQAVLLRVNQEYIRSAAQSDKFRTEPPFKLQGSYRNMNKIAEKIVSAMTDKEVEALIDDHYQGEAQTLTTAAEQNLLKLSEMRGRLLAEKQTRWNQIKDEFVRQRRMGGATDDPVTRLAGSLGGELATIRDALNALGNTGASAQIGPEMRALRESLVATAKTTNMAAAGAESVLAKRIEALATQLAAQAQRPVRVDVQYEPTMVKDVLEQQLRLVERTLLPLAQAGLEERNDRQDREALNEQMAQISELIRQLDARVRR